MTLFNTLDRDRKRTAHVRYLDLAGNIIIRILPGTQQATIHNDTDRIWQVVAGVGFQLSGEGLAFLHILRALDRHALCVFRHGIELISFRRDLDRA